MIWNLVDNDDNDDERTRDDEEDEGLGLVEWSECTEQHDRCGAQSEVIYLAEHAQTPSDDNAHADIR